MSNVWTYETVVVWMAPIADSPTVVEALRVVPFRVPVGGRNSTVVTVTKRRVVRSVRDVVCVLLYARYRVHEGTVAEVDDWGVVPTQCNRWEGRTWCGCVFFRGRFNIG